jgi:chromosome partitioning protein
MPEETENTEAQAAPGVPDQDGAAVLVAGSEELIQAEVHAAESAGPAREGAAEASAVESGADPVVDTPVNDADAATEADLPDTPAEVERGHAAAGTGAEREASDLEESQVADSRSTGSPRVFAVANQKGGVGKTTTAVNLGAALADLGHRVLIVDLDPQGNASTGLGIDPRNFDYSMYDVLLHDVPLDDCIEPTNIKNLFIAPSTLDLAGAEIELVPALSREHRLRRALEPVREDFAYIFIDCPPSLGLITLNALTAASEVLVPIQCEFYALEGVSQLTRNVELVRSQLNPTLAVTTIVLTMHDARTKLSDSVVAEVRAHFGAAVCANVIPRTVRISEAPSFGEPITVHDPTSRGAIAYRELAKEVSGVSS